MDCARVARYFLKLGFVVENVILAITHGVRASKKGKSDLPVYDVFSPLKIFLSSCLSLFCSCYQLKSYSCVVVSFSLYSIEELYAVLGVIKGPVICQNSPP